MTDEVEFVTPFFRSPDDITSDEKDAMAMLQYQHPITMRICQALRFNHSYWQYLVQHVDVPCVGSLATELIILLDDRGRSHVLLPTSSQTQILYILTCMKQALCNKGIAGPCSQRMADSVIAHITAVNMLTTTKCITLTECTNDRLIVLRLGIKSIGQLAVNPSTQKVWFKNGHANVVLINTNTNQIILVEPTGMALIPAIEMLVLRCLIYSNRTHLFSIFHNIHKIVKEQDHATDDNLCTVWCAIFGMVFLSNKITSRTQFMKVLQWASHHKTKFLQLFLLHARAVLLDVLPP